MRSHLPVALLLAGFALNGGAARADCAATLTEFDDVYCYAKSYITSDDELNAAYKTLTAKLDADTKTVLKKSQRAWMKSRNDECGETSSDGYAVHLSCAIDFTQTRTQFLRDRTAECDAGKCDLAKMAEIGAP